MHVNLPIDKTARPSPIAPAPAPAAKSPAGNFSDLLKSAQASASAPASQGA